MMWLILLALMGACTALHYWDKAKAEDALSRAWNDHADAAVAVTRDDWAAWEREVAR